MLCFLIVCLCLAQLRSQSKENCVFLRFAKKPPNSLNLHWWTEVAVRLEWSNQIWPVIALKILKLSCHFQILMMTLLSNFWIFFSLSFSCYAIFIFISFLLFFLFHNLLLSLCSNLTLALKSCFLGITFRVSWVSWLFFIR